MPPVNSQQNGSFATAGALIALVDDDASFLRSLGRLLRSTSYRVQTFSSARQFLDSLKTHLPQCLVLDVLMPDMTGLELQEHLVALGVRVPIIFVTAFDTPQTRERARRSGCVGLLLKPFDKEVLLRAIQEGIRPQSNNNGEPQIKQ
jgi:FixJ family two-component response regulator